MKFHTDTRSACTTSIQRINELQFELPNVEINTARTVKGNGSDQLKLLMRFC